MYHLKHIGCALVDSTNNSVTEYTNKKLNGPCRKMNSYDNNFQIRSHELIKIK
jgi:hypothetical protein